MTQAEQHIAELLKAHKPDEAIAAATEALSQQPESDMLYYLRGNAYRKKGDWQGAISNYLEAIELNPDSPAKNAYEIANDILDFFNKDMYNQ